jgi:carbamate kinase
VRVLIALGGNAMTAPDGRASQADQLAAVARAAAPIAALAADGHELVLTHGNGPQVGNLLVKNEMAATVVPPVSLDWCVAQTQGTIGFILLNAIERALDARGVRRPAAALVSRALVDADDPGFRRPTKPIGRYLPADEVGVLMEHGQIWEDRGLRGWRRMVASPEPLQVVDAPAIEVLLAAGFVVVANGGGGIPVVRDPDGTLRGVEAVIDKDLGAALLARTVHADALVIATDVEHVMLGYGTPDERPLEHASVPELRAAAAAGQFGSGSMGPKVDAVCRFVEAGGQRAVITSLDRIADAVNGTAGTAVNGTAGTAVTPSRPLTSTPHRDER